MQCRPSLRSRIRVGTGVEQKGSEFIMSVSGGQQECIKADLRCFRGPVREPPSPPRVDRKGFVHAGSGIEQCPDCADLSLAGGEQKWRESSVRARVDIRATLDQCPDDIR